MIFTDKFVYIHEPKTGGTFVTSALLRLHGIRWHCWTHLVNTLRHELVYDTAYGRFIYHNNKHGTCCEIPPSQRKKIVLATIRNPYDLLVSQYEFGWWKRREVSKYFRHVDSFEERYGSFPALSFAEFVTLMNEAFGAPGTESNERLGWCSTQFVKYYFKRPAETLADFSDECVASGEYKSEMFAVHFIRTDNLNRELHAYLAGIGYEERDLRFILDLEHVLPGGKGRGAGQRWEKYYTPELKRQVREKERHLFTIFPEFDL